MGWTAGIHRAGIRRAGTRRVVGVAVVAVLAPVLLAGCSRASSTSEAVPPLSGLPARADAPVLAVKVDNAPVARPWTGVDAADVVYVEPVEGGTTRMLAVFSSHPPPRVGPVRSFRESDLTLLAQYGRPALAYSGAAPELLPALQQAPVAPVSPDNAEAAFTRDPKREAPHNLYADPAALLAAAGPVSPPGDVGFRFGDAAPGGVPASTQSVSFGTTRLAVTWDAASARWRMAFDGKPSTNADGSPASATTVVVQRVATRPSAVRDVAGNVSPYADTVGSGPVDVLREGQRFTGTWSRPDPGRGTSYTTAGGAPITFAPGPVWVLLVPRQG